MTRATVEHPDSTLDALLPSVVDAFVRLGVRPIVDWNLTPRRPRILGRILRHPAVRVVVMIALFALVPSARRERKELLMKVLVAFASRHGPTRGIAERITEGLRKAGLEADVADVQEKPDPEPYEAFVIGSAAYMFHWMKEATAFVHRHRDLLASRPVWLFSSGPLGTDRVDDKGNDLLEGSRPKEFDEYGPALHARGERVFFGAWDPNAPAIGLVEKLMKKLPSGATDAMPSGDFRDWPAIDAWAAEIAAQLTEVETAR